METYPLLGSINLGFSQKFRSELPSLMNDPISGISRLGTAPTPTNPQLPLGQMKVLSMLGQLMWLPAMTNSSRVWKVSMEVRPRADELSGRQCAGTRVRVWLWRYLSGRGQPYFQWMSMQIASSTTPLWVWQKTSSTSSPPRTLIVSLRSLKSFHSSLNLYWNFPDQLRMVQQQTSLLSMQEAVVPQATVSDTPMDMVGRPSGMTPNFLDFIWLSSVSSTDSWQQKSVGMTLARCGSLARMGLPVEVCCPATTQLLDPVPSTANQKEGKLIEPRLMLLLAQCFLSTSVCLSKSYSLNLPISFSSSSVMMVVFLNRFLPPQVMALTPRSNPTVSSSLCLAISQNQSNSRVKESRLMVARVSSTSQSSHCSQKRQNSNGSNLLSLAQVLMPSAQACRQDMVQGSVTNLLVLAISMKPMLRIYKSDCRAAAPKSSATLPSMNIFLKNRVKSLS